ncbi:unnamed protein product [Brassica oleracea var. botrytis]
MTPTDAEPNNFHFSPKHKHYVAHKESQGLPVHDEHTLLTIERSLTKSATFGLYKSSVRVLSGSGWDKLNGCSSDEKFLKIQKAWQVLSDAELRVVYDNDLRSSRLDGVTADELIQNCLVQLWKFSGKLFDFCTHLC